MSKTLPFRVIGKRRETITALPLYYSGQMQKKCKGEKVFQMYHGELRGSTMFFYTDEKQETYCERLELHNLKSMESISSYSESTAPIYTLRFPKQEVQLQMDNPDTGELWRGFILTVAKLEVPRQMQLLPGQVMRLEEMRTAEEQRRALESSCPTPTDASASHSNSSESAYDATLSIIPSCFLSVLREEAEKLLEQNPEHGSIILRPATDNKQHFSITTRQIFPSGPVIRNYKITSSESGYTIQLDNPVTVQTLNEVVDHFLEKTAYQLKPFTMPQAYDTRIKLPPPPLAPKPKVIPKARVPPTIHTQPPPDTMPPTRPLPTLPANKNNSDSLCSWSYVAERPLSN
ncbi:signal-transducing adaptor protein 1-like isoform X2 [Alosa sapidissima]|uniref:signal-transducing adaptor protein 1-like isoform X2 n=1 Tax=Alosa sapidissima TaxID=34773 RepID=UPI001C0A3343|nr:signal-transducing adaptor protein 1-like isoform X2 [Alosa sapidissima]